MHIVGDGRLWLPLEGIRMLVILFRQGRPETYFEVMPP